MDDTTRTVLAARAMVVAAREMLDRALDTVIGVPRGDDDREIVATTAMITETYRPRSRADAVRFVRAVKAGDEAWLVVRSVPGEQRADAKYYTTLPGALLKSFG